MKKKCCAHDIDELNKGSVKPLKIRFCPDCKSTDVKFVFKMKNMFGLLPRVECTKCGYKNIDFPLLIVSKKALDKKAKKVKKVKKKTAKKIAKKTVKKTTKKKVKKVVRK